MKTSQITTDIEEDNDTGICCQWDSEARRAQLR